MDDKKNNRINERRGFLENNTKITLDLYEIPTASYGCEAWKLTCHEEKIIDDQVQTLNNSTSAQFMREIANLVREYTNDT